MCPALGKTICSVCCGTKRLVEIQCPPDCVYLATAREHPAAATIRKQQDDIAVLARFMRDLSERQGRLLFLIATFLVRYQPLDLQVLIDEDVVEAMAALAATFETASRGVIYEHKAATMSAERLANALKPLLAEAGKSGGRAFERDAAVVMRRIESAAKEVRQGSGDSRRAFVDLLDRMLGQMQDTRAADSGASDEASRLIIP